MSKAIKIGASIEIQEFRARVYEILERHGHKAIDGDLYYPESAIMDALEFLYHEVANIPVVNFEAKLAQAMERAINRLGGNHLDQGLMEEKITEAF